MYLVIENGAVTKKVPHIKEEFPNVSFPASGVPSDFLAEHNLVKVTPVTITSGRDVVENVAPYQEGTNWYTQKVTPYVSPAEIPPTDEEVWESVRTTRFEHLRLCDWTQLPDAPLTDAQKILWVTYRQALRDIPQNNTDPTAIVWPTPPS